MNVLMEIKTFQARSYRSPERSRLLPRVSFAVATMLLAGLTVVGTGTHAGVGSVPREQVVNQILMVQGQDVLARSSLAVPVLELPEVAQSTGYTHQIELPRLASVTNVTGPGIDPETRMNERTLHVASLTETSALPKRRGKAQWQCLAEALYFEARSEPLKGQRAVAEVILNRVDSRKFPNTVCEVVEQGAHRKNACQFSYNCDGVPEHISEPDAYERAKRIAHYMVDDQPRTLTDGATYYHTVSVNPSWSRRLTQTTRIGKHVFFRDNAVISRR